MADPENLHNLRMAEKYFAAAIELPSELREACLDNLCTGNAPLRHLVKSLLDAHARASGFLESQEPEDDVNTVPDLQTTHSAPAISESDSSPANVVGNYRLLKKLGEGGFGDVFLAEQIRPVRRRVALKILKPGMDSRQVIARFETEKQALAMMDHPNIAKFHDAGQTQSGRPYFVMELIQGSGITDYSNQECLNVRNRLQLIMKVCYALQHAHHKGIIHRDIKPSNVMICTYDGRPEPKIIDFGIGKALGSRIREHTTMTPFRAIMGTLEYLSPEQAGFAELDIDARSDVYSLGVLMFELIAGSTPITHEAVKTTPLDQILRKIREDEVPRLMARLSTLDVGKIAAQRGSTPAGLARDVHGDIEWIVIKAVEKDRTRRYQTPQALAEDIARFLDHEPVLARPPTALYKAGKFYKRHRASVIATGVAIASLFGGMVASFAGWHRTRFALMQEAAQRERAERAQRSEHDALVEAKAQRDAATEARNAAESAAARANSFSSLLSHCLLMGNPINLSGAPGTISDFMANVKSELDARTDVPDEVRGQIYSMVARSMLGQGSPTEALRCADLGLELTRQSLPADSAEVQEAIAAVALARVAAEDRSGARELINSLESNATRISISNDALFSLLIAKSLLALANHDGVNGERYCTELVKESERLAPNRATSLSLSARLMLITVKMELAKTDECRALVAQTLTQAKATLGETHSITLMCSLLSAMLALQTGNADEARITLEQLLPRIESTVGSRHALAGVACVQLGMIYQLQGRREEAASMLARSSSIGEELNKNPGLQTQGLLMFSAMASGDPKQLESAMQKVLAASSPSSQGSGLDFPKLLKDVLIAMEMANDNQWREMVELLEPEFSGLHAVDKLSKMERGIVLTGKGALWMAYSQVGRGQEAGSNSSELLEQARVQQRDAPEFFRAALFIRCIVLFSMGRANECLAFVEKEIKETGLADSDSGMRQVYVMMRGISFSQLGRWADAEPLLVEALKQVDVNPVAIMFPSFRLAVAGELVRTFEHLGKHEQAEAILRQYAELESMRESSPRISPTASAPSLQRSNRE